MMELIPGDFLWAGTPPNPDPGNPPGSGDGGTPPNPPQNPPAEQEQGQ